MSELNRFEFTDDALDAAVVPAGKSEIYLYDTKQDGLALRVREGGSKSFLYVYTKPGVRGSQRHTIGPFPRYKVKQARIAAGDLDTKRLLDRDPIEAKSKAKEEAKSKAKVTTLVDLIGEKDDNDEPTCPYGRARKIDEQIANWKVELSALRRNLLAEHKRRDIRKLTRLDITNAMEPLNAAGKHGAAKDLWKHTYAFLGWCVEKGYIDTNPLFGAKRKRKGSKGERLDREEIGRVLTDDEIIKVWNAAGKLGSFGLLARMCLLGGPRRSEPSVIKWNAHVFKDRVVFPARQTKMGRRHDIPRTHLVNEVLDDAARFKRATGEFVFPSSKTGGQISGFTKLVDRLVEEAGVAKFTMHDLRRTLRTIMSRCGYDDQIQRACVGQKAATFDAIYNRDDGWFIRRCAFDAAHDYIAALIGGKRVDNVISFQRAKNPQNKLKLELLERLRQHQAAAV
jgi:integrase